MLKKLLSIFHRKQSESTKKAPLFVDVMKEYIPRRAKENNLKETTIELYTKRYDKIVLFMQSKKLYQMSVNEMNTKFVNDFEFWMRSENPTIGHSHVSKHKDLIKNTTTYAFKMGYIDSDPLLYVECKRDKPKPIEALEKDQLKHLMVYNFRKSGIQLAADLFVFQCYTGLDYADLYKFQVIKKGDKDWIQGGRMKNDNPYIVYFFDEAREIYHKYNGEFPTIANQTYNRYLKIIAAELKIPIELTTKIGRKTHATLLDQAGVSPQTIANQLGNTERIVAQHYVKKSHVRTENEFLRLGLDHSLLNAS